MESGMSVDGQPGLITSPEAPLPTNQSCAKSKKHNSTCNSAQKKKERKLTTEKENKDSRESSGTPGRSRKLHQQSFQPPAEPHSESGPVMTLREAEDRNSMDFEEDVIEGFAILSFLTYEECEKETLRHDRLLKRDECDDSSKSEIQPEKAKKPRKSRPPKVPKEPRPGTPVQLPEITNAPGKSSPAPIRELVPPTREVAKSSEIKEPPIPEVEPKAELPVVEDVVPPRIEVLSAPIPTAEPLVPISVDPAPVTPPLNPQSVEIPSLGSSNSSSSSNSSLSSNATVVLAEPPAVKIEEKPPPKIVHEANPCEAPILPSAAVLPRHEILAEKYPPPVLAAVPAPLPSVQKTIDTSRAKDLSRGVNISLSSLSQLSQSLQPGRSSESPRVPPADIPQRSRISPSPFIGAAATGGPPISNETNHTSVTNSLTNLVFSKNWNSSVPPSNHLMPPAVSAEPIQPNKIQQGPSVPPQSHPREEKPPASHRVTPHSAKETFPGPANLSTVSDTDFLRRELDARFIASQDRSIAIPPPPYMRQELAHGPPPAPTLPHNYLQPLLPAGQPSHAPPMFDPKFSKMDMSAIKYAGSMPVPLSASNPGYVNPTPTPSTCFTTINPSVPALVKSQPYHKMKVPKSGKWCAMHVRIAWEIYNHQHKNGHAVSQLTNSPSVSTKGFALKHPANPPKPESSPKFEPNPKHHVPISQGPSTTTVSSTAGRYDLSGMYPSVSGNAQRLPGMGFCGPVTSSSSGSLPFPSNPFLGNLGLPGPVLAGPPPTQRSNPAMAMPGQGKPPTSIVNQPVPPSKSAQNSFQSTSRGFPTNPANNPYVNPAFAGMHAASHPLMYPPPTPGSSMIPGREQLMMDPYRQFMHEPFRMGMRPGAPYGAMHPAQAMGLPHGMMPNWNEIKAASEREGRERKEKEHMESQKKIQEDLKQRERDREQRYYHHQQQQAQQQQQQQQLQQQHLQQQQQQFNHHMDGILRNGDLRAMSNRTPSKNGMFKDARDREVMRVKEEPELLKNMPKPNDDLAMRLNAAASGSTGFLGQGGSVGGPLWPVSHPLPHEYQRMMAPSQDLVGERYRAMLNMMTSPGMERMRPEDFEKSLAFERELERNKIMSGMGPSGPMPFMPPMSSSGYMVNLPGQNIPISTMASLRGKGAAPGMGGLGVPPPLIPGGPSMVQSSNHKVPSLPPNDKQVR